MTREVIRLESELADLRRQREDLELHAARDKRVLEASRRFPSAAAYREREKQHARRLAAIHDLLMSERALNVKLEVVNTLYKVRRELDHLREARTALQLDARAHDHAAAIRDAFRAEHHMAKLLAHFEHRDARLQEASSRALRIRATRRAALGNVADRRDLVDARREEKLRRRGVAEALQKWLPEDPDVELRGLDASYPLLLLPVRIETRFAAVPGVKPQLLVRIYPDEIFATAHDSRLTRAEVESGQAYWATNDRSAAWVALLQAMPPQRAAWVVRATNPLEPMAEYGSTVPATVPESIERKSEVRLLPDRWHVLCYRDGEEVHRASGLAIHEPLAVTPDVEAPDSELVDISGDGLTIDEEIQWTLKFAIAEQVGMAVRVQDLSITDLERGFDRVLVFGVKGSLDPVEASEQFADLLERHRYGRGLALVKQGTRTNNTRDMTSGYPPDNDASATFERETAGIPVTPTSDAVRLFRDLGLAQDRRNALARDVFGANEREDENAQAMNRALWPATLGYALEQILDPVFGREEIDDAGLYFATYVRGRGPLPAFRIGATPYGVLPVASLQRWAHRGKPGATEQALPEALRRLSRLWLKEVPRVPRIGRSPNDPDRDLIEALGLDASTRAVRVRPAFGHDFYWNLFGYFRMGAAWPSWAETSWRLGRAALDRIGHADWNPRILRMVFDAKGHLYTGPLVTHEPLSETPMPAANYIAAIAAATVDALRLQPPAGNPPQAPHPPLLQLLLRHSTLLAYARAALDIVGATPEERREHELVQIVPGTDQRKTVVQKLATEVSVNGVLATASVHLQNDAVRALRPELKAVLDGLEVLKMLSTGELERLFTETLDTCSHRLDAWITSLATKRLRDLHDANKARPGCYLGAFAWVEDLRRADGSGRVARRAKDGRAMTAQVDSGGFIHAPSLPHAAAAAVLRNAYLTHSGPQQTRYAIDLSSARVRLAQWLLDAVRNGQPLSAVFGYLFERWLHDAQLEVYKDALRTAYRHPTVPVSSQGQAHTESIAPRDVLDGYALYEAKNPFAPISVTASDRPRLERLHARLREVADAVADLLVADAVYQIVGGGMNAAASSLDAVSKGARPPEAQIARMPRGGTPVTHRIVIVFDEQAIAGAGWSATPRALLAPAMNSWVGSLFPAPASVRCRVSYRNAQPGDPERRDAMEVSLDQLQVSPLDVLAMAQTAEASASASELDARIAYFVRATAPKDTDIRIIYERDPAWDRAAVFSFPELLELARALDSLLTQARPLRPEDMLLPEREDEVQEAAREIDADDTVLAASVAVAGVREAVRIAAAAVNAGGPNVGLDELRLRLLDAAGVGVPGAIPATRRGAGPELRAALMAQATSVMRELEKRLQRHATDTDGAREQIARLFGGTLQIAPGFTIVGGAELAPALAASPALGDALAPTKWLQRVAKVRAGAGALRRLRLYASALGRAIPDPVVAQLPHVDGGAWVARAFGSEAERPPPGRVSIVRFGLGTPASNATWRGLLVDEWTEIIPSRSETTGLAFQYDDPGAEAAQSLLLAVPPGDRDTWDLDALVKTIEETIDLVKIRAVDASLLGDLGQLLPAICLASNAPSEPNTAPETISTDFTGLLSGEPTTTPKELIR
jgi:hypothetical protein